jgi:hypothetical protein
LGQIEDMKIRALLLAAIAAGLSFSILYGENPIANRLIDYDGFQKS